MTPQATAAIEKAEELHHALAAAAQAETDPDARARIGRAVRIADDARGAIEQLLTK